MPDDLNDVITSAVKARVEVSVLEALSGDQFYGQMVASALAQRIEVRNGYDTRKTTFLAHTLESVIRESVQNAAKRLIVEQAAEIEEAVRKELRKSSADIAKQLVGSVSKAAESAYGIRVELKFPSGD